MRAMTVAAGLIALPAIAAADPLPSWNSTETKDAIIAFVDAVTDPASEDYVPEADRIAVFDNDGTLWAEQPLYFQGLFAFDVLREKAAEDPSILTSDPLRAANEGDLEGVLAGGMDGLVEILDVSHGNITPEDFKARAAEWLATATHPQTGRPFGEMTYQPMLELLSYLRDEEFTTYIVSGGGIDFIRAFSEDAYGIPPWQVVGTEGNTSYALDAGGTPTITKDGGVSFVDDKAGKPVGIMRHIGRRPIFAAGNSDGDFEMLDWTTAGEGPRFGLIVHHTDSGREFAYDRDSHIGQLVRGLDEGPGKGWTIVDMAADWKTVWAE
ncbi:HAD family hydrolase [Mangrovicoccus algicola]|uniref:Haloacid dehalogenase-like hydrolase n=1 Tax=Mangrovicoccus algicola TaxID=2771008 RepID=A0A8J6YXL2_9RHOB|nr:HAD family hydrolase [Mangrovicoccus algicola]MBE3639677.1 haloacid dehalogenase-like hydrolase [Mangrovicoccus algicola]